MVRRQEDMGREAPGNSGDSNTSRDTFYGSAPQEMWAQMVEKDTDTEEQVITCYGSAPEELWTEVAEPADMQVCSSAGNLTAEVSTFLDLPQIDPSELQIGEKIAEGGQACVYLAVWKTRSLPVVVKCYKKGYRVDMLLLETQLRKVMSCDSGERICEVLGVTLTDNNTTVSIVIERMLGDLRNLLNKFFPHATPDVNFMYMPLLYKTTIGLMLSIAEGMEDLHSCGVVHKDLKASNIFITDEAFVNIWPSENRSLFVTKGYCSSMTNPSTIRTDSVRNLVTTEENQVLTIQLDGLNERIPQFSLEPCRLLHCIPAHRDAHVPLEVQFGSPYRISQTFQRQLKPQVYSGWLEVHDDSTWSTRGRKGISGFANLGIKIGDYEYTGGVLGTGFWRAPEVLQALKDKITPTFSPKADVYSYGMVCYELLSGLTPFQGHPLSDYDLVLSGQRPILPHYLTTNLSSLLQRCWDVNERQRPEWSEIKRVLVCELRDYHNACRDEAWDSNCTIEDSLRGINPQCM